VVSGPQVVLSAGSGGENGAGSLAAEQTAEEEAVTADPLIDDLRDLDDSRDPEKQGYGHEQGQAQTDEADAARAPVDAAVFGDAVNRFLQVFAGKVRGEPCGGFMGQGDEAQSAKPVQPCQDPHLKGAQRAFIVIEHNVSAGGGG